MTEPDLRRGPIAWMTRNTVSANLLMLVLVVGGLMASLNIKKEVFPEFTLDSVTITMSHRGASPEDIEQGIVLLIEAALEGLPGIAEVESNASEGSASVTAELLEDADATVVLQDIQQAVARITHFPEGAEQPRISLAGRNREVLTLLIHGRATDAVLRELAETARDQLLASSEITQVELEGVRDYRIHVDVPSNILQSHDLSLSDVASRIADAAMDASGGSLQTDSGDLLVRVVERRDQAKDFATLPLITTQQGAVIRLGDVARVTAGFDETASRHARFNGDPALALAVYRTGAQTPDSVAQATYVAMEQIRAGLPEGVDISVLNDASEIYRQRLALLIKNALLGLVLVLGLMALFLEFKLAFWVTMGIPIAFFGALLFLPALGTSINMISMFAFIISLGIVVDDAVVAGENIYEYRQRGMDGLSAAIAGARDVALPITFSVLSNIVAFMPLLFVPGFLGKIWGVIPAVVCTVFLVSLVESLFVLPSHLAHAHPLPQETRIRRWRQHFNKTFTRWVNLRYQPALLACLRHRYLSLTIGLSLLIVLLGFAASGRMGMELMPSVESDFAEVTARLPVGTPADRVAALATTLEQSASEVVAAQGGERLSTGIYTLLSDNSVRIRVFLTPPEQRPISTSAFVEHWRRLTPELPETQAVRFLSTGGGPGSGPALTLELSHRDIATLNAAADALGQALSEFPQVSDVDAGQRDGKTQFEIQLRDAGRALGLTARDVSSQLSASFLGTEALRQQDGRNEVRVLVRLPATERQHERDVESLLIRTPAGTHVPLSAVARLERTQSVSSIRRRNGRRTLQVSAVVTPPSEAGQVLDSLLANNLPALQQSHPGLAFSLEGRSADMRDSLQALGWGLLAATGVIYALLAVPFRSYVQPLIVLFSIPFGVAGAVLGHLLMGYAMSVISVMGVIALAGVVVNDSLVMVHYANGRRLEGADPRTAITEAGVRRFRPILLTTLSTFGGLAPMIFETSRQAQFMIPMAISMGFGILFATAITLLLVPCLYMIVEDVRPRALLKHRAFGQHLS